MPVVAKPSIRAGRYITQSGNYKAFIPEPLPPVPPLAMDAELTKLLSDSDRALGRLDGSIQTLPNPDLFIFMYVRKEAVLSSQIEGTQASINDVIKAEADLFSVDRRSGVNEVINYVAAMNHGLERLDKIPLSMRLIREIHEKLMQNVRGSKATPGELRRSQNWIGPQKSTLNEATFIPPPHHLVAGLLSDLEKFLHDKATHIPALIRIGLAHAQFETIHPFLDGNGRIGRLLITFFLCEKDILQKPVLYLSHYFRRHQSEYYDKLQRVRDFGEWEGWIKFFLKGLTDVAGQAAETSRKIVALREKHRSLILEKFGGSSGNAMKLLESMFERPYLTVSGVQELLEISFANANGLVRKFEQNNLLFETTGYARNRVFAYTPYLQLFADNRV